MSALKLVDPRMLALWALAKPWKQDEWVDIVSTAIQARLARSNAAKFRQYARFQRSYGESNDSSLSDARFWEWKARQAEAKVRYFSDVRGHALASQGFQDGFARRPMQWCGVGSLYARDYREGERAAELNGEAS